MEKKINLMALALFLAASITLSNTGICAQTPVKTEPTAKPAISTAAPAETIQYQDVSPLELVANPQNYLNKNVKITAQFDKFSTIGLDYPPVGKNSKDHISFMIKRPDVLNKSYSIPLSELKLIIKRDKAEKLIDLESGDKIEIKGKVISSALNDPWIDVNEVKILEPKTSKKDKK